MAMKSCKSLILRALRINHKTHDPFPSFAALYSTSEPKPTLQKHRILDILCTKHNISSDIAAAVAADLSDSKTLEKCDTLLSFLKANGFSESHLEKILTAKRRVIGASLKNTIEPKVKTFQDLGFSDIEIADIIANDPLILSRRFDKRILPSIKVLKDVLGSMSEVARLISRPGRQLFLWYDLEKNLLPNIELLKSCGVSMDRITRSMFGAPRFLLLKPERIKEMVATAEKLGCDKSSMMFLHALKTMASMGTDAWEQKWELFRNLGIPEEKVLWMFQKKPQVFGISDRKIKAVVKVLLDTGEYDIDYITDEANVLICSIEKRLKPRLKVLEILESEVLLKKRPRLSTIYTRSNEDFVKRFISPYLDKVSELKLFYENVWLKLGSKHDDILLIFLRFRILFFRKFK